MSEQKPQDELSGGKLIKAFYHFTNMVRIHQDNNQAVKDCVTEFGDIVSNLSGDGELSVQIWRGRFHLQGEKLVYQRETFHLINEMLEYFLKRGLGGICFLSSFKKTQPQDLIAFMHLLNDSIKQEDPPAWLDAQLEQNGFSWVEIFRKQDESRSRQDHEQTSEQDPGTKRKVKARNIYFNALDTVREVTESSPKDVTGIRKARRLAQTIVDMVHEDSSLLLQLASIRSSDDYTYLHSVNVALLAACLGKRMGLSQVFLEHLAVCALFHDSGMVGSADEVPFKQGDLSFDKREILRRHPLMGLRKILQSDMPSSLRSKIIPGLFEHHLNLDMTGYPETHFVKRLSLLGKILHIADVYEMLTSELIDPSMRLSPDEALRRLWGEKGKLFDEILLKNFISMMGIFPIGSVVELDSGEIGLVMQYTDESVKDLPIVMLLKDDGKGNMTRGETIDLSSQGGTGPRRNILKSVPLSRIGIQPSQFFKEETEAYLRLSSEAG